MFALLALALMPGPAATAAVSVHCEKARDAMPASLNGWERPVSSPAIGNAFIVSASAPATIRGLRISEVGRTGNAALVPIEVPVDATYHVALSDRAWVAVVAGSKEIQSISNRRGPACSGIARIVDFPLKRGRYALQITGISTASVKLLIERA